MYQYTIEIRIIKIISDLTVFIDTSMITLHL